METKEKSAARTETVTPSGLEQARVCVPRVTPDMPVLAAALAYAEAGLFVLPVARGTKNPGSVVGAGWQNKSSRDTEQLCTWFGASDVGVAIHLGASDLIAFDVDYPERLADPLRSLLLDRRVPFQATQRDCSVRGHYLFSIPAGSRLGNSVGDLGSGWGDVRAGNAVIMASPSSHPRSEGLYRWIQTGVPHGLPAWLLQRLLSSSGAARTALSLKETLEFVEAHDQSWWPELLELRVNSAVFVEGSRHATCTRLLVSCLRDAVVGAYPAGSAIDRILDVFAAVKPQGREALATEFIGIVKWAVSAASFMTEDDRNDHLSDLRVMQWIHSDAGRSAVCRLGGGGGGE